MNNDNYFKIKYIDSFDAHTDTHFQKFIKDFPYIVTLWRNQDYMNWRIHQNPYYKHRIIGLYHGENLIGYAVIAIEPDEKVLVIVDILVLADYLNQGLLLLYREIKNIGLKLDVGFIKYNFVPSNNDYCRNVLNALVKAGFSRLPFSSPTVIKKMTFSFAADNNLDNWYINTIFTEGII